MRPSTAFVPLLLCALPAGAGAQSILEWPLLVEARPTSIVSGVAGVLGNPAALASMDARAQALVTDLETPEAMGLRALTVAGAVRLLDRWAVAAAYRHVEVGDMLLTDGPPLDRPPAFEVAEDVYALGTAARFYGFLDAGVTARVDKPAHDLGGSERWTAIFGLAAAPETPLPGIDVRAGATATIAEEQTRLSVGLEAGIRATERLDVALAYGTEETGPLGWAHSVVASGLWDGMLEVQAGFAAQPGAAEREWVPVLGGLLHLGRYRLGAVREHLPNGFGAAMHYQLAVSF